MTIQVKVPANDPRERVTPLLVTRQTHEPSGTSVSQESTFFLMRLRQIVERLLSLFQIERVEAFGEPAVHRSEQVAGRIPLALIAPEPRHTHRRAQFPRLGLLLSRDRERT